MKMSSVPWAAPQMTIIPDLFQSHIIPDLLSEHLHYLILVDDVNRTRTRNPFYTLPLVSRMFYYTCKKMSQKIFDNEEGDGDAILREIEFTRNLWVQAKLPQELSDQFPPPRSYEYGEMMSSKSLIRVYICTAIAHIFFNVDVSWPFELEEELRNAESDHMDLELEVSDRPRRYIMRDDTMHRVYLPLTCAMKICDGILPERLAYIIAKHLADIVPRYSTMPVLLKYTQDLETYVARKHRVDMNTWAEWTYRTLSLIRGTSGLLEEMQCMGELVKSFGQSSSIPQDVITDTNIITALQDVMLSEWGPDTDQIRERAQNLLIDVLPEDLEEDAEDLAMDSEDFSLQ